MTAYSDSYAANSVGSGNVLTSQAILFDKELIP